MTKKTTEPTKELTTKQTTAIATTETLSSVINPEHIILPALAIRQNSYKQDYMKQYKPGDLILRPKDVCLAHEDKPVTFIPVSIEHCYRLMDITEKIPRTVGYEDYQDGKPLEYEENGKRFRRDRSFVAHVLLREGLDAQAKMFERAAEGLPVDPDDFALPCRVVFSRASYNAGKVLNTHFELSKGAINKQTMESQSPAALMFELKTVERKNDQGIWFAFEVSKVTDTKLKYTPNELLPIAKTWVNLLGQNVANKFKADESAEEPSGVTVEVNVKTDDERF